MNDIQKEYLEEKHENPYFYNVEDGGAKQYLSEYVEWLEDKLSNLLIK